jgi:hypothetical protein
MIYFPGTINIVSTRIYTSPTCSLLSSSCAHQLTLCILASWSHEGSSSLPSCRLLILPRNTSYLFPCPDSTDAPCSRLEDPVPPSPKWRPHSQGPRTLPYRGPRHILFLVFILCSMCFIFSCLKSKKTLLGANFFFLKKFQYGLQKIQNLMLISDPKEFFFFRKIAQEKVRPTKPFFQGPFL